MMRLFYASCSAALLLWAAHAYAGEGWNHFDEKSGFPGNEVQFIRQQADGSVMVGASGGLAVFKDGKPTTPYKGASVYDVLALKGGKLVLGTANGIVVLEGTARKAYLKGSLVAPVVSFNEKIVWAISKDRGTEINRLVYSEGAEWKLVERFAKQKVVDLYRARNGHIWISLDGNGVIQVDPAKPLAQSVHHLKGENINCLYEDAKGRLWVGLRTRGLRVFEAGKWATHLPKEKSTVFVIRSDAKGQVFVATSASGLLQFDGKKWNPHLVEEGAVNVLEVMSDGSVWVSTQTGNGLSKLKDGKWSPAMDSPLPVRCLMEDKNKKVWVGGVLDGLHVQK